MRSKLVVVLCCVGVMMLSSCHKVSTATRVSGDAPPGWFSFNTSGQDFDRGHYLIRDEVMKAFHCDLDTGTCPLPGARNPYPQLTKTGINLFAPMWNLFGLINDPKVDIFSRPNLHKFFMGNSQGSVDFSHKVTLAGGYSGYYFGGTKVLSGNNTAGHIGQQASAGTKAVYSWWAYIVLLKTGINYTGAQVTYDLNGIAAQCLRGDHSCERSMAFFTNPDEISYQIPSLPPALSHAIQNKDAGTEFVHGQAQVVAQRQF